MQIKQLLLKLKQLGVDITNLQQADTQILERMATLEGQLGDNGSVESRLEALRESITLAFTQADDATKESVKVVTDALTQRITSLETAMDSKADETHTHEASEVIETAEKQFVSEAKKTQYDENTIYTNDMKTVNALGGIAAGTSFDNVPVKDVLTKLLYPYVAPTISATGTPNGGTFEKGDNKTITNVRVVVNKKSEQIKKIDLYNGSALLGTKEGDTIKNGGTFDFPVEVAVPSTNVQLTAKVTDALSKLYSANTGSFNFVYPYYIGKCSNDAEITQDLIKGLTKKIEAKGNKSQAFTCDYERMVFAYPKAHGKLKQIIDPNNFDITGTFGVQEVSVTGRDGSAQTYYVYVNSASTVSNFTVKFNY